MMALSLWQPWASLWLTNAKIHETRPRRINYRGWLAVQAAQRPIDHVGVFSEALEDICLQYLGANWRSRLPFGAVLGAVEIVDCYPTEQAPVGPVDYHCGNYSPGRLAIKRHRFFLLPKPVPISGRQSLFRLPDWLDSQMEQMAAK